MNIYFDETIASKIYDAACDMDMQNYSDSKEEEINMINQAIDKIYSYAPYNNDFLALYNALLNIYGE